MVGLFARCDGCYENRIVDDKYQRIIQKDKKLRSGGTIEEFVEHTGGTILTGKLEESDELLIELAGLIRSGQPSPGPSGIGQRSSSLH